MMAERLPNGSIKLLGHLARRNPQWVHFRGNQSVLAIFNGPHSYITPSWYVSGRDVPTWNYAVVHASGPVKLIEDFDGLTDILKKMTARFESGPRRWEFELPDDLTDASALTSAIVGFELLAEKIDAKFKLSQNRSKEDQQGVVEGLSERTDEMSRMVRSLMIRGQK
jgi:transcriptional regulator